MSTVDSVDTPTDSRAGTQQPESTIPSSPMTELTIQDNKPSSEDANMEPQEGGENDANGTVGASNDAMEDTEGMDTKAKALMHLLQTSSVSCRLCATHPHVAVF
jgi:ATP-dependent DNA helicase